MGQAVQEECQEHLHCYRGNGMGGEWFSENALLANRVSGMGKWWWRGERKCKFTSFLPSTSFTLW